MSLRHYTARRAPEIDIQLVAALTPRAITLSNGKAARESHVLSKRFQVTDDALIIDWMGYVHHSSTLVAALVEAYLDPDTAATTKHAKAPWIQTCTCIWRTDGRERALATALAGEPELDFEHGAPAQVFNDALRRLIALDDIRPFFGLDPTQPDFGTHHSVRPVGYETHDVEQLALVTHRKVIRALPDPMKALLALITTAYGNETLSGRVFKGPGLALKTGPMAAALLALPPQPRRDALMLIASYSGW